MQCPNLSTLFKCLLLTFLTQIFSSYIFFDHILRELVFSPISSSAENRIWLDSNNKTHQVFPFRNANVLCVIPGKNSQMWVLIDIYVVPYRAIQAFLRYRKIHSFSLNSLGRLDCSYSEFEHLRSKMWIARLRNLV